MIYVIVGPTACGKTEIALALAKKLGCEIINADSRQVYKYVSVGTGKPCGAWQTLPAGRSVYAVDGIVHHLVDFVEPTEVFNAGMYAGMAREIISQSRGDIIVAGGTGLYIKALFDGLAPLPQRNDKLRAELAEKAMIAGRESLHKELISFDPVTAAGIHPSNIARVIRAIEVYRLTGKPISVWHQENAKTSFQVSFRTFGILWDKTVLKTRIRSRVNWMLKNGMIDETKALVEKGYPVNCPCLSALGYRTVVSYLQGGISAELMETQIVRETLSYAKRQMTWFRKDRRINWLQAGEPFIPEKIAELIYNNKQI